MRVIHILWNGQTGGAERSVYQLAKYQHCDTTLEVAIGFGKAEGEFAERARSSGIPVHHLEMRTGHDVRALRRARLLFRGYDVHHFHCAEPLLIAASRLCPGARRIYTHRAGVIAYSGRRAMRYAVTRMLLRGGFAAVTGAPQAALAAERLFGVSASAVVESFNGLDLSGLEPLRERASVREELGVDEDTVLIGTAATLRELKRVDWLLRIGGPMPSTGWKIVVIGDGPDRERLEMVAADNVGSDKVAFVGLVTDMGSWLRALDVFVLPTGPEEGFGNAVVEAMAVGLPVVVCSDSPGLVAHVRAGINGVVVSDVNEMSAALALLIADLDARCVMGDAARRDVAARYSMDRCSAIFQALYEQPPDLAVSGIPGKVVG